MSRSRRASATKIVDLEPLLGHLRRARADGCSIAFTNGCFDLLHPGHIELLERAAELGDLLVVGLNDDASIRRLKGDERPFQPFEVRARLLAALESVDWVVGFSDDTPARLIDAVRPDTLVKGGDWELDRIVGRDTVVSDGGRVVTVPLVADHSTSGLVERIRKSSKSEP